MAVNYQDQYEPHQLEPFWPNEIAKMTVVVLCTLAVLTFLAVLPVLLEAVGLGATLHEEQPADPGTTPLGIKPEWYFLAVYQYLKLMPPTLLGISGKTFGVLSQAPIILLVLFLPFWYRRRASQRPGILYRTAVTGVLFLFLALTLWGGWPETHDESGNVAMASFSYYFGHNPMLFVMIGAGLVVMYALLWHEKQGIRKVLGDPHPVDPPSGEDGRS